MTSTQTNQKSPTSNFRLLLDVTIAATTDLNTGIQRVVRNIARHAETVAPDLNLECVPVVCHGDRLSPVGFDGRARLDERIFRSIRNGWMGLQNGLASLLSKINRKAGPGYLSFLSRLRKLLVPKTIVRGTGNLYRRMTGQTIQLEENDVLVLLDASWDLPLEHLLLETREKKIPLITVIYDLIPVLHPEFHRQQLRDVFRQWLERVVDHSELIIGISKTVKDDVAEFIQHRDRDCCQLDHFRLGSDFSNAPNDAPSKTPKSSGLTWNKINRGQYYLAVGTVEPRKNHSFLLDALEQLWQSGSDSQLVIVGKVGWMCEEVADRIRRHPELNRKLFLIENATDQQLAEYYQNARALVFPSIVEGFGLPIVEAFQHQLPVLASDTRIHREVAGDGATYFSLESPSELAKLIARIESHNYQLVVPDRPATTWEESCRELLTKIHGFLGARASMTGQSRVGELRRTAA